MNKHLPSKYFIKSSKDFGQQGVVFKTPCCAKTWIELRFGKGGYEEGLRRGMFTIGVVEEVYYPCPINPEVGGC